MDTQLTICTEVKPFATVSGMAKKATLAQKTGVQSVERALRLMDIIADAGGEVSLTEISNLSGLNISTCHHLLATLANKGYVARRHGQRSYMLGAKILRLRDACLKHVNLPAMANSFIDQLNANTLEAVQLAVLQGDDLVTVLRRETKHAVRVDSGTPNKAHAAHATATGKAILAWLPEGEAARILSLTGLQVFTPNTITDWPALVEELRLVRRNGFSMDREEFQPGVICVGAAVRDESGAVVAALSVSTPTFRADEEKLAVIRDGVMATAAALSVEFGRQGT